MPRAVCLAEFEGAPNSVEDQDREVGRRSAGLGPHLGFALVFTLVSVRLFLC